MQSNQRKAYLLLIGFLFLAVFRTSAQDQKVADSLAIIYQEDRVQGIEKLELLRNLAFNELRNTKLALQYAEELIRLAQQKGDNLYLHRGYFQKGSRKRLLGDLEEALDAYFRSLKAARDAQYVQGEGVTYSTIADVYSVSNNHSNAKLYYNKAIATLRKSEESIALASVLSNAGDEFFNTNTYDTALVYFKESGRIFEKLDYSIGKA